MTARQRAKIQRDVDIARVTVMEMRATVDERTLLLTVLAEAERLLAMIPDTPVIVTEDDGDDQCG